MKYIKLVMILFIVGSGIILVNVAYGTSSGILSAFTSPANPFVGKGTQYLFSFNETNTLNNVAEVDITFSGTTINLSVAKMAVITGLPQTGTVTTQTTTTNKTVVYKFTPTTITQNSVVEFFIAKIQNPTIAGANSAIITIKGNTGAILDQTTVPFGSQAISTTLVIDDANGRVGVGITPNAASKLDVNGNIRLDAKGNITSPGDICIGAC